MKISQNLSDKIQNVIDEFVNDKEPFFPKSESSEIKDLRDIAKELNVIPIDFEPFASWGLKADGSVIFFQFEEPHLIKSVKNQKIINMVYFGAANKYETLKELMPIRNKESIICPGCDGAGKPKEFAHIERLKNFIKCNCGGVGWLPSDDKKYLYF